MADAVDYAMWKSQKAWELAMRIIPDKGEIVKKIAKNSPFG